MGGVGVYGLGRTESLRMAPSVYKYGVVSKLSGSIKNSTCYRRNNSNYTSPPLSLLPVQVPPIDGPERSREEKLAPNSRRRLQGTAEVLCRRPQWISHGKTERIVPKRHPRCVLPEIPRPGG